jgi:hypothetical protein
LDRFGPNEINDLGENLLILYASIPSFFNNEVVFNNILQRRNGFKLRRDWYLIFNQPNIFQKLKIPNSPERSQFDKIVLGVVYDRGFYFMTDYIFNNSHITTDLI